MEIGRRPFGVLPDGRTAELCTLASPCVEVSVSTLGATLVSVRTPDRGGHWADIALGFNAAGDYLERPGCLGATIGRYAGRIAHGRFSLNGRTVELERNRPPHTIHGGPEGFHRRLWTVLSQTEQCLELSLRSPNGDQGFPGAMTVTLRFTLQNETLTMETRARSEADTVCSLTNHVYWNLCGHDGGTIDGHLLSVSADRRLETDDDTIPTGRILPLDGPFAALRASASLAGMELDHTLLLPEGEGLRRVGRLEEPSAGRRLEVFSDLPAVQVYTGDHLPHGMLGKGGAVYGPRSGICLEAQFCPDSPNHPNFPDTRLRAGEEAVHIIRWRFGVLPMEKEEA